MQKLRIFTQEIILFPGDHYVELPLNHMLRRTFIELLDAKVKEINLEMDGGRVRIPLYLDTPPILGLLNGTTVLCNNWGVIDYRNLDPNPCIDAVSGLNTYDITQASLRFRFDETKHTSKMKLFHEVC